MSLIKCGIGIVCTLALLSGCASQGELDEAHANQATLSTDLQQARKERDQWQDRYEKLSAQQKDLEKKLAERNTEMTSRKAELDSAQSKLADANAELARSKTSLETAQKDQQELKVVQQKLETAQKSMADLEKQVSDLKSRLETAGKTTGTDSAQPASSINK